MTSELVKAFLLPDMPGRFVGEGHPLYQERFPTMWVERGRVAMSDEGWTA